MEVRKNGGGEGERLWRRQGYIPRHTTRVSGCGTIKVLS